MLHERICQALGDPKRLMILYLLNQRSYHVGELALEMDTPQPTLSHHLKILRERSLIKARKEGTQVCYTLADNRVVQVIDLLRGVLRDSMAAQARLVESNPLEDKDTE
ncbi:MAG: metalloregulator ArsR/SmtB family transcription factor [Anaerolineae bacterium]|nr:metalloregulator ArsR/SmtB family transcription factor [Anaerolineae bacterium]